MALNRYARIRSLVCAVLALSLSDVDTCDAVDSKTDDVD